MHEPIAIVIASTYVAHGLAGAHTFAHVSIHSAKHLNSYAAAPFRKALRSLYCERLNYHERSVYKREHNVSINFSFRWAFEWDVSNLPET